jgi:hypothetical protein
MLNISKAFVDCIEFRQAEFQNIQTTQGIARLHQPDEESDVNLLIYVLQRDCKLLELKDKLESS